jgi:hypothetical protein
MDTMVAEPGRAGKRPIVAGLTRRSDGSACDAAAMDDAEVRRAWMAGQRLEPRARGDAATVARAVVGLQAQDAAAARLAVRVRSRGLTAAAVDGDEAVVRTWAWRRTLHLLHADDVPWVLSLVAPGAARAVAARWRQLGLDEALYHRARALIGEALAGGPRSRADLRSALAAEGIDASGQRLPHLVGRAALDGLLQARLDGTYTALRLPPAPSREEALAALARRYLAAYGPAEPRDLAAWSGLAAADVRAAWATLGGDLEEVTVRRRPAWRLRATPAPPPRAPIVRLLPAFDTALLGHRSRELIVDPEHARRVRPGGGWLHPVVLVDGRAVATWRLAGGDVTVEPFSALPDEALPGLEEEIADVRRFGARQR